MSCKFAEEDGKCPFADDGIERPVDKNGICLVEDDPNPEDSCEDYQER